MSMGFSDVQDMVKNPAKVFFKWSAGCEKVKNAKGEVEFEGGKLYYYDKDKDEKVEVALPLTLMPLRRSYNYIGFQKDKGRFWSNEFVDFGKANIMVHLTGEIDEVIASGKYNDIKDKVYTQGARLQNNIYCYSEDVKGIVRLNLTGSAKTEWKKFLKGSPSAIFRAPVIIDKADEPQETPIATFVPPKFALGKEYTPEQIALLREQDKIVGEYLDFVQSRNEKYSREDDLPSDSEVDGFVAQEHPPVESQEVSYEEEQISIDDIPF